MSSCVDQLSVLKAQDIHPVHITFLLISMIIMTIIFLIPFQTELKYVGKKLSALSSMAANY